MWKHQSSIPASAEPVCAQQPQVPGGRPAEFSGLSLLCPFPMPKGAEREGAFFFPELERSGCWEILQCHLDLLFPQPACA